MNNKVISLKREIKDDYNYRESLKTLRTNIQFCGSNIRTIMFTSALPDEGKSDIAFSVAASFAQIGKKVIFIDADIRKSVLVCGLTVVEELLNDTIQTEEDVEKYMGLTVLASVPLREGEAEENKNEQTLSRSHMHNKNDKKKGKQGDRK